ENGVATAIQSLYMYLHRAGIRPEHKRSKSSATSVTTGLQGCVTQQSGSGSSSGSRQPTEYSIFQVACDVATGAKPLK
ncbi:hypothetical protein FRC00_006545, partial [Tulasnella sp. 408]